ncbi:uncharacterized protein (TIGR02217 family) [Roseibium hamelinense]|uniref:Uncharacterized protein (TIGR02217 family) n=1 Tax=Roseibium hamelinense TaxID=150831 RepID=A0A562T7X7_9HYPH|nr:DUF2460 domain-containing protein [Roseibium hamelinense]MTI43702.1 TIGR02217 family protein [Roseibium hamelinense]TWI89383.1 uncharacterized protein (TIGR02217 family) [Roseibium hamelinense]
MTAFLDERFPAAVAFGALGGPERRTEIVDLATGHEARNARWADSRRRYDAATGIRSLNDLRDVLSLFEKARGRLSGFRFRDPFDHSSAVHGGPPTAFDQTIGTGDGATTRFTLVKTYGAGPNAYTRAIRLPEAASLKAAVGGSEQINGAGFSADPATGALVFSEPPPAGQTVTAGFLFDVPVRFDTDRLDLSLTHFEAGDIASIPLIEIRLD